MRGRRTKNHADRSKKCGTCGYPKEPDEYYKTKYGTLYTDCKACLKEYKAQMWRDKYSKTLGKEPNSVVR